MQHEFTFAIAIGCNTLLEVAVCAVVAANHSNGQSDPSWYLQGFLVEGHILGESHYLYEPIRKHFMLRERMTVERHWRRMRDHHET